MYLYFFACVLRHNQKYFTYTMGASVMVGGNRAVPGETTRNPRPSGPKVADRPSHIYGRRGRLDFLDLSHKSVHIHMKEF